VPTDALANPLVLPILGLLVEQPRHAYAIFDELRARYAFLRVRNSTVYTLLNTLTGAEWITATPATDDRQQYRLTQTGRRILAERVEHDIRETGLADVTAFMTSLAYVGTLSPAAAAQALQTRAGRVRAEMARLAVALNSDAVSELHMIEAHYFLDRLQHDCAWLDATIERVRSGDLTWPNRNQSAAAGA
jgi:DNA-binding PadR family transcriptional regulator